MYKCREKQMTIEAFDLPFDGCLSANNRWVKLSALIPWDQVERLYGANFKNKKRGAPAMPARMAFGALLIREKLGLTDDETVEQLTENPYLQFFCGMKGFCDKPPFDPSMLVHFRKRFPQDMLNELNEIIAKRALAQQEENKQNQSYDENKPENKGKLLVDATCAPADITYPTDLKLLNRAREKTEEIIDVLHKKRKSGAKKPRTYRKKARKQYLSVAKNKRKSKKVIRKNVRRQLGYVSRNLKSIGKLSNEINLLCLSKRQYRDLLVINELYRQQKQMFDEKTHRVDDRIVSISQPHVRPIKRGKSGSDTEFGAKISVSVVGGFSFVEHISWNNFNESKGLVAQIENYKRRFGFYPKSVHADKIYRNRNNRKFCKERNIRMSGPRLGRPPLPTPENAAMLAAEAQQARADEIDRIPVEGKFGEGKRRYKLDRLFTKLAKTSETVINLIFLVMNLQKWMAHFFCFAADLHNFFLYMIRSQKIRIFLTLEYQKTKNASPLAAYLM